ncbi:MAG: hypothetical protein ACOYYJ_09610 [Chloroflexota bacterium]
MIHKRAAPSAGMKRLVWLLAVIVFLIGLVVIWAWTIPFASQTHRYYELLATEAVLTHGQVLSIDQSAWDWLAGGSKYGHEGSTIEYQFTDANGRVWRGQGRGYQSIDSTGNKVLLVTYARSDPSINRLGNYTGEHLRQELERSAAILPTFILVLQGGGLSLVLGRLLLSMVMWAFG